MSVIDWCAIWSAETPMYASPWRRPSNRRRRVRALGNLLTGLLGCSRACAPRINHRTAGAASSDRGSRDSLSGHAHN
jgi:hypothetical protein